MIFVELLLLLPLYVGVAVPPFSPGQDDSSGHSPPHCLRSCSPPPASSKCLHFSPVEVGQHGGTLDSGLSTHSCAPSDSKEVSWQKSFNKSSPPQVSFGHLTLEYLTPPNLSQPAGSNVQRPLLQVYSPVLHACTNLPGYQSRFLPGDKMSLHLPHACSRG